MSIRERVAWSRSNFARYMTSLIRSNAYVRYIHDKIELAEFAFLLVIVLFCRSVHEYHEFSKIVFVKVCV